MQAFARTQIPLPDTGTLHGDMVAFLTAFVRGRRADVETFEAVRSALGSDAELGERCRGTLKDHLSAGFRTVVVQGVARGELPPDTDIELYASLAPALLRFRRDATGCALDEEYIGRIASQFFDPARRGAGAAG